MLFRVHCMFFKCEVEHVFYWQFLLLTKKWKVYFFRLVAIHIRLVLGGVVSMCHPEAPGPKHLFICCQHMLAAGRKRWLVD